MYMNTRANLDYWSTDNFCLRWSLRTGAITIGLLSMVWQSLMVMSGVMMLVKCPITTTTTTTTNITTDTTTSNLTLADDILILDLVDSAGEVVVSARARKLDGEVIEESDRRVRCMTEDSGSGDVGGGSGGGGGGGREDPAVESAVEYIDRLDSSNISIDSGNSSSFDDATSNSSSYKCDTTRDFECPWLPDPVKEVLCVYSQDKLLLVASIFIVYSGIYCILSFCVLVGSCTSSVTLLQGWVAFTGFHNIVILAMLLVPLPFTTLLHLFLTIAHFILSLYTWAVVKSHMHALKVQLNKPLLPEGSITDYTVDGVDVTEIPVQV